MDNTDLVELKSILNGAKSMSDLHASTLEDSKKKIAEIRKFAIDAVNDYKDVCDTLVKLINEYHCLFPKPYIRGDRDSAHHLATNTCREQYNYNSGTFYIYFSEFKPGIGVHCVGVEGVIKPNGYSGDDTNISTSNWVCDGIVLEHDDFSKMCKGDLTSGAFTVGKDATKYEFNEENLTKFNWTLDGWLNIKERAELTRIRTKKLVECFKMCIKHHTDKIASEVKDLVKRSEVSAYEKVAV